MFRKSFVILLLIMNAWLTGISQPLTVMTYNLRYDNPGDGANAWSNRSEQIISQILTVKPDLLGTQEGLLSQLETLDSAVTGYQYIGKARDDGKTKGEYCAIFYNSSRMRLIKEGTFWLSDTPEKVSMGWDAACRRVCTYGLFEILNTGRKCWIFNTHFDHIGSLARKQSAVLILQKMEELNQEGYPVILTGDFNSPPQSEPINIITSRLVDSKTADKSFSMAPEGTFNNFDTSVPSSERIDYVFTSKGFSPNSYTILRESHDERYPSDHFPVIAVIR